MLFSDNLIRIVFISLFFVLILWGCNTAPDSQDLPPILQGMIFSSDNQPLSGILVTIDGTERAVTDINGQFFAEIDFGSHAVILEGETLETVHLNFNFYDRSHVLYSRMIGASELIDEAAEAIESGDMEKAEGLLNRAETAGGRTGDYLLTRIILSCHLQEYERARTDAEDLSEREMLSGEVQLLIDYIDEQTRQGVAP